VVLPGKYNANTVLDIQKAYVNGTYLDNRSGETFASYHPAMGHKICEFEIAGQSKINVAVEAAKVGFQFW